MVDSQIAMVGNIVTEPELRFSREGKAACTFRFVQADRVKNKQTGEYGDRKPELFLRVTIFGNEAEHVVESDYKPGTRVIMLGTLRQEPEWTDKEGNVRPGNVEFIADEMGPSNRFATATVERVGSRQNGGQQRQAPAPQQGAPQQSNASSTSDPWGASAGSAAPAQNAAPATSDPWAAPPAGAGVDDPWAAK